MAARGHDWEKVLREYPADLVINLYRAGQRNQRAEAVLTAYGTLAALQTALAALFGKKGDAMEKFAEHLLAPPAAEAGPERPKNPLSPQAQAFFKSLMSGRVPGVKVERARR